MPPKTTRKHLEPIPVNLLPFKVGAKIAFPDVVSDEEYAGLQSDEAFQQRVEYRHPKHRLAGMYGRVEEIGVADGSLQFYVTVIDPATGLVVGDEWELATMEEIQ